jgi:hypothetical protein
MHVFAFLLPTVFQLLANRLILEAVTTLVGVGRASCGRSGSFVLRRWSWRR